jgi:hypothetical protein
MICVDNRAATYGNLVMWFLQHLLATYLVCTETTTRSSQLLPNAND